MPQCINSKLNLKMIDQLQTFTDLILDVMINL